MKIALARWVAFSGAFLGASFSISSSLPSRIGVTVVRAASYESLMLEGIGLRRSGDDSAALMRFQQAYEINPTPKALAQIGLAEQAVGKWAGADRHLRQARGSEDDPWILKNRSIIDEALLVIATHVGQIEIGGTPAGAEVRVDGEVVGRFPLAHPIAATAGGVAIEVRSSGYVPIVRAATVVARTLTRESFTLQSLSPASETQAQLAKAGSGTRKAVRPTDDEPAASTAAASDGRAGASGNAEVSQSEPAPDEPTGDVSAGGSGHRWALVFGGLSVASLAFGIVEHLSWQHKVDSFQSNVACGTTFPMFGTPDCKVLHDDGQRARLLAFVGYGVTGALAATAIILYFADPGRAGEPGKVACAPALGPSGMACAMRF